MEMFKTSYHFKKFAVWIKVIEVSTITILRLKEGPPNESVAKSCKMKTTYYINLIINKYIFYIKDGKEFSFF